MSFGANFRAMWASFFKALCNLVFLLVQTELPLSTDGKGSPDRREASSL